MPEKSTPKRAATLPSDAVLQATPSSYEEASAELADLLHRMENGQLKLDELMQAYARGGVLLQFCRDKLQAVEQQFQVMSQGQTQ